MNENNPESDIINHLLEVEKNASILIDDALKEAERNKAKALSEFNKIYKEKFDKEINEKSQYYENLIQETKDNHQKELNQYKEILSSKSLNIAAFNKEVESLLFSKN
ncbi:MAG: hypothetical protein K5866_01980 [Treponema sp.]|nr:hypothetical protein [Treponema sp.]